MRELYIRSKDGRIEIAVVEDEQLAEYFPAGKEENTTEAICLGRVERVVPGMKAAFVQLGQEKNGFLPLEEHNAPDLPRLQTGQSVLVQVRKEAQGLKGAFLSRDISLCGEYVLLMPFNHQMAVSTRIARENDRNALRELARSIAQDRFGLVMRTSALHAPENAVAREAEELFEQCQRIRRAAPTAHVPSVLHAPRTTLDMVLDDYRPRGIDAIYTNDAALAERLRSIAPVRVLGDDLMDVGRIPSQLAKAQERRVWLSSGGTLIIDRCEAMTVIDVNTAKYTGKRELEETVLRINLEACRELARQARLRNLSGIIIADLIDMKREDHRQAVLKELEEAFQRDRVKTVIHGFTSLGLVEMTRKRSRAPLSEQLRAVEKEPFAQEEQHG